MSDDILTRLQRAYDDADEVASVFLANESANEIKRLEADRDRWQQVAWLGHKVIFSKWEYTQFEQAYEEALEAVRGE